MINKRKIFIGTLILFVFFIFLPIFSVSAKEKIEINFIFSPTCHFCSAEELFLDTLEKNNSDIVIIKYDITDPKNVELIKNFYTKYNISSSNYGSVPMTFIGDKYTIGYNDKVANTIKEYVNELSNANQNNQAPVNTNNTSTEKIDQSREFKIPFFGKIDVNNFSPILLSIVVGTLDGFNACAMVALAFLLTVLVGTGNRKKVLLIGSIFIFVSGLVYFLFITAWLNLFMFIGYLKIINIIISFIIIFFAVFLLKDYLTGIVCKICDVPEGKKESIFTRIQKKLFIKITQISKTDMSLSLVILTVIIVAAGINLVELVCSLGFPMAYTKILTSHHLSTLSYYLHILVYIFFYMIDDIIIFLIAVFTLKITNISEKYLKFVKLLSGIVLFVLGISMLLKK